MKVVAVTGTGDTTVVAQRLVERLERDGSVATVTRSETEEPSGTVAGDDYHSAGASRQYELGDDGWLAAGTGNRSLNDVLDDLAPRYDYAVVDGFDDPALPTVTVGEGEVTDRAPLSKVPSTEEFDPAEVVAQLADVDPYETLESLVARAKDSEDSDKAGAIATFTGRVRARDDDDDPATEYLEFERYDEVAEQKMATIREELEMRDGVYEVILHHKTGVVEAEEDIVFVVVLAGHRPEAFATVEDGINRLKAEVPLFKKEVTVEGTFWAHQHDHEHDPDHDGSGERDANEGDKSQEAAPDSAR